MVSEEPSQPDEPIQPGDSAKETSPAEVTPTVTSPVEEPSSETTSISVGESGELEPHRPGLGPMIKKKQGKDIAGAFKKAANAYGGFKPRPGGAGERLLAAAKKSQAEEAGPDGITGVVPAPSLTRSATDPPQSPVVEKSEKSEKDLQPPSGPETPTVEITEPQLEEAPVAPAVPHVEIPESSKNTLTDVVQVEPRSRTPSPSGQGRRRRRREDNTLKYCQALGIDPGVLDGRGIDFDDILSDLGWNGRLADEQKIEDLEADVRREIGRVEATSWLGNLEQQEGKVEQLASLIDRTIEECDELDGLLTLYSHELNVSCYIVELTITLLTRHFCRLYTKMWRTSKLKAKVCKCRQPTRSFFRTNSRTY
jgi:hypothetical protein